MPFYIDPPLLNSANPWATTIDELRSLYDCEYTGAVTTRTCTLQGFAHDDAIHQYTFFDPQTLQSSSSRDGSAERTASLNTLGYSPISLPNLIELLVGFCDELRARRSDPSNTKVARKDKPFIISITGTPEELKQCYAVIKSKYLALCEAFPVYIEINLSCPNISGKPPPAYSLSELREYLHVLSSMKAEHSSSFKYANDLQIGIKTPPYTNPSSFTMIRDALLSFAPDVPISFITATNTLGSALLLGPDLQPALKSGDGTGVGGLAGAPLHPLALGNVRALRAMCDSESALKAIQIIGIGGVSDSVGFARMKAVGASAVGVGTALGRRGVGIFEEISKGDGEWQR